MTESRQNNQRIMLPEPTLRRLPWYLAYVKMLDRASVDNVSSTTIAKELNVDASQIAKDLSFLDLKGKTRIGYDVHTLAEGLEDFLGFSGHHKAVVIGAGSLGSALMRDLGLAQYGLHIVAGFDIDPARVGTAVGDIPVLHVDDLPEFIARHNVSIAVLTVPVEQAQEAADAAIAGGITALWNFTPFRIKATEDIVIANTSIYAHLAIIYNRMSNR